MNSHPTTRSIRHEKVEAVWACLMTAFFVYTLLVWQGVIGTGQEWRPAGTALLAGALAAQAVAPVVGRRYPWLLWLLLAVSVVALWLAIQSP